jgi:hypothetical protein
MPVRGHVAADCLDRALVSTISDRHDSKKIVVDENECFVQDCCRCAASSIF